MASERSDHTLAATDLVYQACLRLLDGGVGHFFGAC